MPLTPARKNFSASMQHSTARLICRQTLTTLAPTEPLQSVRTRPRTLRPENPAIALRRACLFTLGAASLLLAGAAHAQAQTISYGTAGSTYTQDFNGLNTNTGAGETNPVSIAIGTSQSTVFSLADSFHFKSLSATDSVAGWYGEKIGGSGTNFLFETDNGVSTRGALYNYADTGSTNFALGSVASGTTIGQFGAVFTNTTGGTLTSITISYTGEEWRNGGSSNINTLTFSYSVGSGTIDTSGGTFQTDTSLNYADTVQGSTATNLDGSLPANQLQITSTITGLTWTNNATLAIRWADANDAGNDDGIAIDNFSLVGVGSGVTPQYWNPNGAVSIGGSGTWDATSNFWNPKADASGVSTTFASANSAIFSGTAGTVIIASGGVTSNGGVEFTTNGYIVNGPGALTLGAATGGNMITVDNAGDKVTFNAQLTGSSGLQKSGAGTLILGNTTNNFTGGVQINGGAISIADDRALGDPSNDITFNLGALQTTAGIATARNFSGSGGLNIQGGTTLTVNGNFNTTALTLSNTGTLDLEGGTTAVGALTFSGAGVLTSSSSAIVNATGLTATNLTGTATISLSPSQAFDLGSGTVTVDVGAAGDLVLATPVLLTGSGNTSLKKTGAGTLELDNDNADAGLWKVQIGTAATGIGGTVIINNNLALGISQLFHNFGTLSATTDLTGANAMSIGVSIGGLDNAVAIFAGSNMEFDGPSDIFQATSAHSHITVNNTTILGGAFTLTGTGAANNLFTVDGSGTLVINGDASAMTLPTTISGSATLSVNSAWAAPLSVSSATASLHLSVHGNISGATNVNSGALTGNGILAAVTIGDSLGTSDALLAPGETADTGTLNVNSLTLNSDAVFSLKINTSTLANDLVKVTGLLSLVGGPVLTLFDLNPSASQVSIGTQFVFIQYGSFGGGMFSDGSGDMLNEGSIFQFGMNKYQISYDGGPMDNEVLLTAVVPEPTSWMTLISGAAALAGLRRFRRGILK